MIGERFVQTTGQPWVYDYKAGAAGFIAAQALLASPPDGYTILLGTSGLLTINPHTFSKLPYDPMKDFLPIAQIIGSQMAFAAAGTVPASSLAEFVGFAKGNPGKTNFASFTAGNPSHFAGVILNQLTGMDMTHVPFNGSPPATLALLGGQVQTGFLPLISVKQHIDSGKLKAFAITGSQRSPLLPNVPTFKELGFPKMEIYIWSGFVALAGTPGPVVQKLNREISAALRAPEVQQKMRAIDLEPQPGSPDDFARMIRGDFERWEGAVKASGFKSD
ncbi:MAG: tripartite tricarboxylate transporter substrate binding protein [Betaproteobacteria bacterium]|nr:tripartite tricarboxylate transporter substrate binding protein [Betaproteobacteria bacterium]